MELNTNLGMTNSVEVSKKDARKAAKQARKEEANNLIAMLASDSNATKARKVRKEVRAEIKALKDTMDKDDYKALKRESNKGFFVKYLFADKKDSKIAYEQVARQNKLDQTKAEGPKFSQKSQELIDKAGYTVDQLYDMADKNDGSDLFFNYSYKKRQVGEQDAATGLFNKNDNNVEFSKKDTKRILRELGYDVEKTVRAGEVVKESVKWAAGAAPIGFVNISQSQVSEGVISSVQKQSVKMAGWPAGIGAAAGATTGVIKEVTRVEARVASKILPEDVKTYDDYAKYIDANATKKGANIMKQIARFYDTEKGLNKEAMEAALHDAAGEGSVLNYEEAVDLRNKLYNNPQIEEINIVDEEIEIEDTPIQNDSCVLKKYEAEKTVAEKTDCYRVKAGDNWYAVVEAKYGAYGKDAKAIVKQLKEAYYNENKAELNAKGITSALGAFFPREGQELCIPSTVKVNGKEFNYDKNATTTAGAVDTNWTGANMNASANPFTRKEKAYYVEDSCSGKVYEYSSADKRNDKVNELKKEKEEKGTDVLEVALRI